MSSLSYSRYQSKVLLSSVPSMSVSLSSLHWSVIADALMHRARTQYPMETRSHPTIRYSWIVHWKFGIRTIGDVQSFMTRNPWAACCISIAGSLSGYLLDNLHIIQTTRVIIYSGSTIYLPWASIPNWWSQRANRHLTPHASSTVLRLAPSSLQSSFEHCKGRLLLTYQINE